MSRFRRFVVVSLIVLLWVPLASAIAVAGAVAHSGLVRVEVEERGPEGLDLFLPVPALAVELAIVVVPLVLAEDDLAALRKDAEPWAPALLEAAAGLRSMPDATLVEYREGSDRVVVRKRGGGFEIEVDEPDVHVEVRIPTRTLSRSLSFLLGA